MLARARDFFIFVSAAGFLTAAMIAFAMLMSYASLQPFPPEYMSHLGRALLVGSIAAVGVGISSLGIMEDPIRSLTA